MIWMIAAILAWTLNALFIGLLLSAWRKIVDQEAQIRNLDAVATFFKRN